MLFPSRFACLLPPQSEGQHDPDAAAPICVVDGDLLDRERRVGGCGDCGQRFNHDEVPNLETSDKSSIPNVEPESQEPGAILGDASCLVLQDEAAYPATRCGLPSAATALTSAAIAS